jgi:Nitrogen Permease regulator of amino acid transport activity 3
MSVELDLTLDEVMLYAAHIVSWQFGKVINVITKESIYMINQNLNNEYFSEELSKKFRNKFKNDLVQILNIFSTPTPLYKLKDKIKMDTSLIFQLITWLLKHSYIVEYNYYIYLACSLEEFRLKVKEMRESPDEKVRKSGDVHDKLFKYCLSKTSVGQIAFEEDIQRERIFKILFQEKSLFGYYYTQ